MDYLMRCINDLVNSAGGQYGLAQLVLLENYEWFTDKDILIARRYCRDNKVKYSMPGLPVGKIIYANRTSPSKYTLEERICVMDNWDRCTTPQLSRRLKCSVYRVDMIATELGLIDKKRIARKKRS